MNNQQNLSTSKNMHRCDELLQSGKLQEAERLCRRILAVDPNNGDAYLVLGIIACQTGRVAQGVQLLQQSLNHNVKNPRVYNELGKAFTGLNRFDEALTAYRKAVTLQPGNDEFLFNLANLLKRAGRPGDAIEYYQRAIVIRPDVAVTHNNLGNTYREQGDYIRAEECYRKAISVQPDYAVAYNNLGNIMLEKKSTSEAIKYFMKATSAAPGYAIAHYNLGNALKFQGNLEEALQSYRTSLALEPRNSSAHSIMLFLMNYFSRFSQAEIYRETTKWAQRHAERLRPVVQKYPNSRTSDRKLRIGYVSPDFRMHSVAYFIEPVIMGHVRSHVEIFCYANVKRTDAVTQRLREEADHWRDIFGMADDAVAKQIRKDRIDILVDLTGHTPKNRLLLFGRRPAPVQVSWLGYPNTTGMTAIDYRLTDAIADPVGKADKLHSEKLVRLQHGFLCYQPDLSAPEVGGLPCLEQGFVTFGSFNNLAKVTPEIVRVWSEILQRVPQAKLLLKSKPLADPENRDRFQKLFAEQRISADRLELHGWLPTKEQHLDLYNRIDVGLDPFPYNGTTTTCEALWMGIPVVTMRGERHAGRVGASIMHWSGLGELVVESPEKYIELAVSLAGDSQRLQELRRSLRQKLQQSPLMNKQQFTETLEEAYRTMWAHWSQS